LPSNSAFFFQQGQIFDLDLHIQNPNVDSIYSCDVYINIYTEPSTTTNNYMRVGGFLNESITIPNGGQSVTIPILAQDSTQTNYWNLWKLYSHTHKYGTAFNMWLLNPDGSQGEEIYNGDYSYEDGYDVGYYRWGPHVTVRTWPGDSLFQVNPWSGIIGQTTWVNTGADTVWWGFSAADEMQVIFFLYVVGAPMPAAGINTLVQGNISTEVFPNPVSNDFVIKYSLTQAENVQVDLVDMLGNNVAHLINQNSQGAGQYSNGFNVADYKLAAGIYLVNFNIGGKVETQKLVITN
jgi:hypothetical protein